MSEENPRIALLERIMQENAKLIRLLIWCWENRGRPYYWSEEKNDYICRCWESHHDIGANEDCEDCCMHNDIKKIVEEG